jgi:cytidylate kinase
MRENDICLYITGLAATGKTAIAGVLSRLTNIPIVDSGLAFRLATYLVLAVPKAGKDLQLLKRMLESFDILVVDGTYRVFSGKTDITDRLRSSEIDEIVPRVAGDIPLRNLVLKFLRSTASAPAIVAARGATEPITTGHILQIELKAELDVRAERRARAEGLSPAAARRSIRERDRLDVLRAARFPSSHSVDTSRSTLVESVEQVINLGTERIERLLKYRSLRRCPLPTVDDLENPLLRQAWDEIADEIPDIEDAIGIPRGHVKSRLLLHLTRFSTDELFISGSAPQFGWMPNTFPGELPVVNLVADKELLRSEASRIAKSRAHSIDRFFHATKLPRTFLEADQPSHVKRTGGHLVAEAADGRVVKRLDIRDASRELGRAVEDELHYLENARVDTSHRLVLVEQETDLPVLYVSFAVNARSYMEPILWAFGMRMEEVLVAVRAYGSPRCPRNAMGLFLRTACRQIGDDMPHLKAIVTDINPNLGYGGGSFREAGFVAVGMKHAPTMFIGDEYCSRRVLDGANGAKAAVTGRLPLLPTLIMIKGLNDATARRIDDVEQHGLMVVPQSLYNQG